jgi:hypothetical protein
MKQHLMTRTTARGLATLLLTAHGLWASGVSALGEQYDVCYHLTSKEISSTQRNFYDPYMPFVGPPQSSTRHGKWYDPLKDVTFVTDVYLLINGTWVPQDPRVTTTDDCYNVVESG